jgi:guanylate kinase
MPGPGLLLVLSAPSGAGKTTLARRLVEREPDARFSVSVTTRAPRGQEREGVDYHFVTPERFEELVAGDAFAEWAKVHGNRYGTLRSTVEDALAGGRIAVFDIDVQGGDRIRARWPGRSAAVFLLPPSLEELERRLRGRSTDEPEAIARRLVAARAEIARGAASYDYLVVNDDLERALAQVRAVVASERARLGGRPEAAATALAEGVRRGRLDLAPWLGPDRNSR